MSAAAASPPLRLWRWLEGLGKLLVILVPGVYLLGISAERAYWRTLGLHSGLVDSTVESQLLAGFEVVRDVIMLGLHALPIPRMPLSMGLAGGVLMGLFVVAAMYAWIVLRRRGWVQRQAAKSRLLRRGIQRRVFGERGLSQHESRRLDATVGMLDRMTGSTTLVLMGLLVLIVTPLWGDAAGKQRAKATHLRYERWFAPEHQQRAFVLVYLDGADRRQPGMLLECGSRWCVYFDGMDFVAVAPSRVTRLRACPRIEALSGGGLDCNYKALPAYAG